MEPIPIRDGGQAAVGSGVGPTRYLSEKQVISAQSRAVSEIGIFRQQSVQIAPDSPEVPASEQRRKPHSRQNRGRTMVRRGIEIDVFAAHFKRLTNLGQNRSARIRV
jgi:hypothetical protein